MKLYKYILLLFLTAFALNLHAQEFPYIGGSYAGSSTISLTQDACVFTIPESLKIYWGGNYSGASSTVIEASTCTFLIPEEFLMYRGGSYGGTSSTVISASTCTFSIPEEFLMYRGGGYGGANSNGLVQSACALPEFNNIFTGGIANTSFSASVNNKTINNTSGPYIKTISDTTILSGNCVILTTTGTGASQYSWQPSITLDDANTQSPKASPTSTTTYTVSAGENIGCRENASVTVNVINIEPTTIRYPTQIASTLTTPQEVVLTGILGGVFSSSSTNLKINPDNGLIYPNTSLAGLYTVYYNYGTCNAIAMTTVEITSNTSVGTIEYPSIFKGGLNASATPKSDLEQLACTLNYDFTQLIYTGGLNASATPKSDLEQVVCTLNYDYTQMLYLGGQNASATPKSDLVQVACPLNYDYSQMLYLGGQNASATAKSDLVQLACSIPVGDNFYLGGVGVGYGNGNLTPTTNTVTGTAVAVSSDVTICPGISTTLSATGASFYSWTPSTSLINTTSANPIASPLSTTTYTVIGSGPGVGCINTAKVTVTVIVDPNTTVSYGGYNFDEEDLNLKKVRYINGPLTGTFSYSPTGLSFNSSDGSFTPGLSTSGIYAINYGYTKGSCNYSTTTSINITKLPPTITYTNPAKFYINYNGVSLTPNISGGTAVIFEILDVLPNGLTFNTLTGVISGTPTQLVDNLPIRVRAANYKRDQSINWGEIFTIDLSVKQPVINLGASSISSLNTIYGTPSATQNVNITADNIIDNILVVAPTGFETSVYTNTGFGDSTKMYPTAERNIIQPLYIRLKKTATVGNHNGDIQLTSTSAVSKVITTSTSYVAPATLTITAKYFQKFYGSKISLGVGSRYFTATGLMNNETIGSVTITPSGGTAVDATVGYYTITPSAAYSGTFSSSNYNINYIPGQFQVVYSLYNFAMSGSSSNWVKGTVPVPKMSNLLVSNITKISAIFSGKIPSSFVNIESYGVCYSTTINPTINDSKQINGSTTPGSFSLNLTSLIPGTRYFARAYITIGNTTFYSQNIRFKTVDP